MNRILMLGIPLVIIAALIMLPLTASGFGENDAAEIGVRVEKPQPMSNCCGGEAEKAKVRIDMSRTTCLKGSRAEAIELECLVEDPEAGGNLEYHWAANGGEFKNPTGAVNTWYPPDESGNFTLICEVSDGDGWDSRVESKRVTVTEYKVLDPVEAPDFAAERLVGEGEVTLEEYRGKVVLLNWWATW